jgi:hypothetical protein
MNKENITKMVEACKRFERLHDADELFGERMSRMMDLESADQQFKMDWDALLEADDYEFCHDVAGIHRHADRTSYPAQIGGCFLPRFAGQEGNS